MNNQSVGSIAALGWEKEFKTTAYRYHVLICWVAVIFDPIWAISDYFTSPAHFTDFFIFRISVVAVIIIMSNLLKKRFVEKPEIIALTPFLGISVQNAYMYSVMSVGEFQTHTFAYIALFIGAGMFVLWDIRYSIFVVVFTYIVNIILFSFNSPLALKTILINGGLLTACVAFFTIFLIQLRTNLTKKEIIARLALAESNNQLAIKNEIIEEKNKEINDSINYAQQIQQGVLPPLEITKSVFNDYFVFFKPKDILSGDFFWYTHTGAALLGNEYDKEFIIASIDCTGHGVPGAMVSIVCNDALNKTVLEFGITDPGKILDKARELVLKAFSRSDKNVQDGMDISILSINTKTQQIKWAGANNPLLYVTDNEIKEIKADKQSIGKAEVYTPFTTHVLPFKKNDIYYLFSDGFADQFGGEKGKKFKIKHLKEILLTNSALPMSEQKERLAIEFQNWKGNLEQTDDVSIIGVKI